MTKLMETLQSQGYVHIPSAFAASEIATMQEYLVKNPVRGLEMLLDKIDKLELAKEFGGLVHFQDWAFRRGPRTRAFGVHQDSYQRPSSVADGRHDYAVRFAVYFEDYTDASGCIGFVAGSHKSGQMAGTVEMIKSAPGDLIVWYVSTGHTPNALSTRIRNPENKLARLIMNRVYRFADLIRGVYKFHKTRGAFFVTLGVSKNLEWKNYLKVISHRAYYHNARKNKNLDLVYKGCNVNTFKPDWQINEADILEQHQNRPADFFLK